MPTQAIGMQRIEPILRKPEQRKKYLSLPSVKRWLKRNARKLNVLDVRWFGNTDTLTEWTEVYYKNEKGQVSIRLICGDPPPRLAPVSR